MAQDEPNKLQKTSKSPSQRDEWIAKRLGRALQMYMMAKFDPEVLGQFISEWAVIVDEVGEEVFDLALTEHIRESRYFPSVSELRERAGLKKVDMAAVEALDHWTRLKRFVDANYYEDLGGLQNAEKIPPRVQYAMRIVGGARAIYFMELGSEPFKRKDFIEAYRLAPIHEHVEQARLDSVLIKFLDTGDDKEPQA